jgi:acetyltransferase-like isoleucine patch superfamily enzyme
MDVFEEIWKTGIYDMEGPAAPAVRKEIGRSTHLCWEINGTDPLYHGEINDLIRELLPEFPEGSRMIPPFHIDMGRFMYVGKNCYINYGLSVMALGGIIIKDNVMIGPNVTILTVNHDPKKLTLIHPAPVIIHKNAWIGANVSILPGVTIGEGAVIGTGSIVNHDVPAHTMAAGCPAKVIKKIE